MHWGTTLKAIGCGNTWPAGRASGRPPWRSRSRSPTSLAACSTSSSMPFWPDPPAAWKEVGVIDWRPNRSRSTASTGVMARVVQLGLATIPSGWSAAAWGLTSASTSGTSGCMRQALELSTTTAPRSAATGAHSREMPPPAEKKARSAPSNTSGARAWTSTCSPPSRRRSSPTAPVAPTITAVGCPRFTGAPPWGSPDPSAHSPDHRQLGRAVGVLVAELGLLRQVEAVVDGPHGQADVAGADHAGDADGGGRDHLDVDPGVG